MNKNITHEVLREMGDQLSPKEREIVMMRNGLRDPWTLEETGRHFGVTRERIRQIEAKVEEKIRLHFKQKELDEQERQRQEDIDRLAREEGSRRYGQREEIKE